MKKTVSLTALILAMLFCIGGLAGCAESTDETDASSETSVSSSSLLTADSTDDSASQEEDVIGEVTYVGSSYLSIDVYEPDTEISDYTSLDSVTLSDTGTSQSVTLESDAVFEYVFSGYLYSTTVDEIAEGDMIAVTVDEDGQQEVIILDYSSDSSDADSSSSSEDTDATSDGEI